MIARAALYIFILSFCWSCQASPPRVQETSGSELSTENEDISAPRYMHVTHGVAASPRNPGEAVVWAKTAEPGYMFVQIEGREPVVGNVTAEDDFAGRVLIENLLPGSEVNYRVWFAKDATAPAPAEPAVGSLRLPPSPTAAVPVSLGWGGDLAGQNVCRHAEDGFVAFDAMADAEFDLFVGLGDMIYADDVCGPTSAVGSPQIPLHSGPSTGLDEFRAHWRYSRSDDGLRRLLSSTSYVAVWDDHEIVDDAGPLHDTRSQQPYDSTTRLLPLGRKAFLEYNPLVPPSDDPLRLYRRIRWGKNLELFVLDLRQYRDANGAADAVEAPKSMLGEEQRSWLDAALAESDARWKVVVSSVPISIPTGSYDKGRDGWANFDTTQGFEQELRDILRKAHAADVENLVFLTTDVHFAAGFEYRPLDEDPEWLVHEFASGPLNAGVFPNPMYDPTFRPTRLFYYAPTEQPRTWREHTRWFNFGRIDISAEGELSARIVNGRGEEVARVNLTPVETSAEAAQEEPARHQME